MEILHSFAEISKLQEGSVYALPTDTVYGLSCAYNDVAAARKIRDLKGRDGKKPMIVLIATLRDLDTLGLAVTENHTQLLKRIWPGPVSVVLPLASETCAHIAHQQTLAVRMPLRDDIRAFIARVGPIVSTSANPSGLPPAHSIGEVTNYFTQGIEVGVDTGICDNDPSTVIQILR
ncbi:MAG: hypothetical protein RI911_211 [Candidatus Parcubacteria bacterium]|jgi:L-threonylcarbamoyladenylate synthase